VLKIAAGLAIFAAIFCGLSGNWFWLIVGVIIAVGCLVLDKKL